MSRSRLRGRSIWATYVERDYIRGIATDKLPECNFENAEFALRFARLLGKAAAPNLVVGRTDLDGATSSLMMATKYCTAMARGCRRTLPFRTHRNLQRLHHAAEGEDQGLRPADQLTGSVPDPMEFVTTYIEAFESELRRIQQEYRKRKRGFDSLFRHRRYDPAGSYAYRWKQVLLRLNATRSPGGRQRVGQLHRISPAEK